MPELTVPRTCRARPGPATVSGLAALFLCLVGLAPAHAQLGEVETEGMRLVYFEGSESFLVPHAARTFLNSFEFQKKLFDYKPWDKEVTVLLADFSDAGNAGATSVPRDSLSIQIAPLSYAFETIAANERMATIMNHELVHVATMDQATRIDGTYRRLFGGKVMPVKEQPESILYFYLTTPRVAAPRWYHEGIAVFIDTWMAGGLGRAQGGYDEMVFRSMVRDGATFYDPLGLVSQGTKIDFQLQINSYLYGTRFMSYLANRYSPAQLIQWTSRREGTAAYYSSNFKKTFGASLESVWADWITSEKAFQQKNLEAIRQYPTTPYQDISAHALGSISRAYVAPDGKKAYAAFNYPGVVAHIGAIDLATGTVDRLVDIKDPSIYTVSSVAFDPESGAVFYTTDNGALRDVVRLDPATRKTQLLLKNARIGELAFDRADKSIWGIRHLNGLCSLVRIPAPYTTWNRVVTLPFGVVVYDLDVSPDGKQLSASFGEISGKQSVRVLDVEKALKEDVTPVAQFDFGNSVPSGFVFSGDGRYLYGSSYYTGASNIFRYEIATGKLDAMSNAETGFFRPIPLGGDELIVFRYTGQGFVPTRIQARPLDDVSAITFFGEQVISAHPELKEWMLKSPTKIPYDTMQKTTGQYRLFGGLGVESFYPVLQGYKDTGALGMRVNLSDPLSLNRLFLAASYSPFGDIQTQERLHLNAVYERFDWRGWAQWNFADFYDLFGPTKFSRKGYVFGVGRKTTLLYDEPKRWELDVEGSVSGDLDRLPDYQNVPVDVNTLVSGAARLTFSDVRSSLGHVDDEKGRKSSINAEADYIDGVTSRLVPRYYVTWDGGVALPIRHSSVWTRNAAGLSTGNPSDPFANFYFGGFGNNYVDFRNEKRYRAYYSFPGTELNAIGGRNFVKSMLEWNLPPIVFEHLGTPGFFLTWARPAVFVTGLVTNLDDEATRAKVGDVGAQLDFRFSVLSALDMTFSIGGAVAFQDGFTPQRELMVSLKVLR